MQPTAEIEFERHETSGRLILKGVVDIFEAERLHSMALQALDDADVTAIHVDMANVERLDVAAVQVLCALKNSLSAAGRSFHIEHMSIHGVQALTRLGVTL